MKISACIPTYNRSEFLKEAIESVINQTYPVFEIIVNDDTLENSENLKVINHFSDQRIRYYHNAPSLGQNKNVEDLFAKARGNCIILIHDDDKLTDDSLEKLSTAMISSGADIIYGKQYFMSNNGLVDVESSERVNYEYFRSAKYTETRLNSLSAAILQQLPSNSFLVKKSALSDVRYVDADSFDSGTAIDFHFGIKCALNGLNFFFINQYVSFYRLSDSSVSTNNADGALRSFQILMHLKSSPLVDKKVLKFALERHAPAAICQALNRNEKLYSLKIFFSKFHIKKIFTLGGGRRFLLILSALLKK